MHTTTLRRTAAALAATTALLGATACSNTDEPSQPVDLTSNQDAFGGPAFDGPDNATSGDPVESAHQAAIATAKDFYAIQGQVDADPGLPVEKLATVAGDPVLNKYIGDINLRRSKGVTSTGQITVVNSHVTDSGIPLDDKGNPIEAPAWVHVEVCTDISTWNSFYPDGSSAMDPNRGKYERDRLTVRNAEWPDANGWRVTSQRVEKTENC